MKALSIGICGVMLLAVAGGCRPELAEIDLGPEEREWEEYVKSSYPGYKRPRTAAPAIQDKHLTDEIPGSRPYVVRPGEPELIPVVYPAAPVLTCSLPPQPDPGEFLLPAELTPAQVPVLPPALVADWEEGEVVELTGQPVPEPEQEYIVQFGDSLSVISQKVYRDARHFDRIYDANRDVITNKDVLKPGTRLRIPKL